MNKSNSKQSYWTVRQQEGWGVKEQGHRQPASVHEAQKAAWGEARRLAGADKAPARTGGKTLPPMKSILELRDSKPFRKTGRAGRS